MTQAYDHGEAAAARAGTAAMAPAGMVELYELGLELPWVAADGPERAEELIDATIDRVRSSREDLAEASPAFVDEVWARLLSMRAA